MRAFLHLTQIPQRGERKRKERVFSWATSIHAEEWMEREKKKEQEVWVGAGVSVGWRVVVGDPGWSGKRNVGLLECLGMFRAVGDN